MASVQPDPRPSSLPRVPRCLVWQRPDPASAEPWQPVDYLEPVRLTESAQPQTPEAVLRYIAGRVLREDADTFRDEPPPDLLGRLLRIDLFDPDAGRDDAKPGSQDDDAPTESLYYVVVADSRSPGGVTGGLSADASPVDLTVQARGLEHLLATEPIRGRWVTAGPEGAERSFAAATFGEEPGDSPVRRPTKRRRDGKLVPEGNRSPTAVRHGDLPDGSPRTVCPFAGPAEEGEPWDALRILNYLLAFHAPPGLSILLPTTYSETDAGDGAGGGAGGGATLGGINAALRAYRPPAMRLEGVTPLAAINRLLRPEVGLAWRLRYTDPPDAPLRPEIEVFAINDVPVPLGNVGEDEGDAPPATLPANPNAVPLDLSAHPEIVEATVGRDASLSYDAVEVVGDPVLSVFSVTLDPGCGLVAGWTKEEEDRYYDAGVTGSLSSFEVDPEAMLGGRNDDELRHVFARYVIDPAWDWKLPATPGTGSATNRNVDVAPVVTRTGVGWRPTAEELKAGVRRTVPDIRRLRLHPYIPLPRHGPAGEGPEGAGKPDEPTPMIVVSRTARVEKGEFIERSPARATVTSLPDVAGIGILAEPQHAVRTTTRQMVNAAKSLEPVIVNASLVVATVAAELDERLAVRVRTRPPSRPDPATPPGEGPPANDPPANDPSWERTLRIEVPGAALVLVAPGTVTGIAPDASRALVRHTGEWDARNDGPRLRRLAEAAAVWYGRPRPTVDVTARGLLPEVPIGSIVVAALKGGDEHRATVTQRTYDWTGGTMSVAAGHVEPDFADLQ